MTHTFVCSDFCDFGQGQPDIVEAFQQAPLAEWVDGEEDTPTVRTPDFLCGEIDRKSRVGTARGIVHQLVEIE
ncbi:MAG: hypothetical protein HQL37_16135 [Alphaproteobacteria bacterium]|nr:hypothetical protein [Alphaproteobacteria bacterium]